MKKQKILISLSLLLSIFIFSQEKIYTTLKTNSGEVKIPNEWQQLNKMEDSGQIYLKNKEGVIIAVAENPQKAYPFFKSEKSDFENVVEFYKWDSDYRKESNFKTKKIKENSKLKYIIWKYNDGENDNVFLFGVSSENFLNFLVYANRWTERDKIKFLENLYEINK